jgi:hypothetical protein
METRRGSQGLEGGSHLSLGGGDEHESAPSRQHRAESHLDASRSAAVSANFDETEAVDDAGPSSVAEHELPVAQSVDIPQNVPIASLVPTRSRGFRTVTSVVAVAAVAVAIGLSVGLGISHPLTRKIHCSTSSAATTAMRHSQVPGVVLGTPDDRWHSLYTSHCIFYCTVLNLCQHLARPSRGLSSIKTGGSGRRDALTMRAYAYLYSS